MARDYADNWPQISIQARRRTHNRCCWCFWRKAVEVHHARYRCLLRGGLYGKERPGIDVFPLCDRCHGVLHREQHYLEFRNNMRNRNTHWIILHLQLRYQIRRLPLGWLALAALVVCAVLAF